MRVMMVLIILYHKAVSFVGLCYCNFEYIAQLKLMVEKKDAL